MSMPRARSWSFRLGLGIAAAVGVLGPAPGGAAAPTITEFAAGLTAGSGPRSITAGPDGNLWFTENDGNRIGRITPTGTITQFSAGLTPGSGPLGITAGPDGNLWFTEGAGNRIGRITPAGIIAEFAAGLTPGSGPLGITAGPDGNLWFTEDAGSRIGRITPAGVITELPVPNGGLDIAAGPDGNLWFTVPGPSKIARITPGGTVTEFPLAPGRGPVYITAGPDGNLWFTESDGNRIGRITPTGTITEFPVPTLDSALAGIARGPDGNLWFTEVVGRRIGRITPAGVITELPTAHRPFGIAAGPDGNVWATFLEDRIGRVDLAVTLLSTGTGAGGGPHVKLFSVNTGTGGPTPLGAGFVAYDPGFTGGVQATLARTGAGLFFVTGVGSGGGPHVKLFRVTDLAAGTVVQVGPGFLAYDAGFTGGARVAATAYGSGNLLIATGVGAGGGPHVKVFQVTDPTTGAVVQLGGGFLAYDPGFTGGVNVGISALAATEPGVSGFAAGLTAGGDPSSIARGPDGSLWFTERAGNRIGRITPTGAITEFSAGLSPGSGPHAITAGPDGNLWFTERAGNRIGRITPAGAITQFSAGLTAGSGPAGITAGPDGNLWFTEHAGSRIGRITPAGVITEFSTGLTAGSGPLGITAGPDGNLWFTEGIGSRIGRITPAGAITEFSAGLPPNSSPAAIAAGPDGNLWFSQDAAPIGQITPSGVITLIPFPFLAADITAGRDGRLWFTEPGRDTVARLDPQGFTAFTITEYPLAPGSEPRSIAVGPDDNPWFTELGGNRIGRVDLTAALVSTGTGPGGGPHVKLFGFDPATATPAPLGAGFLAYDAGFLGGVQAAFATVGGDVYVVTGVGSGGGPHIRLFRVTDLATGAVTPIGPGFLAYDGGFTGGARVAATTDGAGHLLVVTGVGSGGGPHVKLFEVTDLVTGTVVQRGAGFMAYDIGFTGGVNVGAD
jgi:streptogramin lyase